jgi:hypothetical protein
MLNPDQDVVRQTRSNPNVITSMDLVIHPGTNPDLLNNYLVQIKRTIAVR